MKIINNSLRLIFFLLCLDSASAQQIHQQLFSTSGKSATLGSFQINWSLGESFTQKLGTSDIILSQGFHQSLIVNSTPVKEIKHLEIKIFPNPTSQLIIVESEHDDSLNIEIFNVLGQCVYKGQFQGTEVIHIGHLNAGNYFAKIYQKSEGLYVSRFQKI